jgi:hypothetical protein
MKVNLRAQEWIARLPLVAMAGSVIILFGSREPIQVVLGILGLTLIGGVYFVRLTLFRTQTFREIQPTFIPPPMAMMIPPVRKTVLTIQSPSKVKTGESFAIVVEMYTYVSLPYLDVSDLVLKQVLTRSPHPAYSITLETPSFRYAPEGASVKSAQERFPLVWKWMLESDALGTKFVQLNISDEILEALGSNAGFQNPIEIAIDVVSTMGLSRRATYWLQRVGLVMGALLTLPFLTPVFKKLGEALAAKLL